MNDEQSPFDALEERATGGDPTAVLARATVTVRNRRRRRRAICTIALVAAVSFAIVVWPRADQTDQLETIDGPGVPADPDAPLASDVTAPTPPEVPSPTTSPPQPFPTDPCAEGTTRFERAQFAFTGVVASIERRVNPRDIDPENPDFDPEAVPRLVPWVTFDVTAWFSDDRGVEYRAWMPAAMPSIGQELLIAGDSFVVHFDDESLQAGEVDPCLAEPASGSATAEWAAQFGGSVVPGARTPEGPDDPELIARIDDAFAGWKAQEPPRYAVTISLTDELKRSPSPGDGECSPGGISRIVVENGVVVRAFNTSQHCSYEPETAPTVADVFSRALELTGATTFELQLDEDGWVVAFYASDRSVSEGGSVSALTLEPGEIDFGTDPVPLDENPRYAAWMADPIDDYELSIERRCFCGGRVPALVTVVDGIPVTILDEEGQPLEVPDADRWSPRTVEDLYILLADFVPDESSTFGATSRRSRWSAEYYSSGRWPVRISLDPIINGFDDELELVVSLNPT